jgi:hypothetical protein
LKREVESEADVHALATAWDQEAVAKPRKITRIEDLPNLEQASGRDIKWAVEGIFAEGALHMLTSEPGAGKSTFMASAAYAISLGLEFMGRATSRRQVLLLDAENPLPAICERFSRLGIATNQSFRVWGQWVGEDPPSAGGAVVLDWVARCHPKPLIIIDSVIAFHPGAENDSNETRKYMTQYRALTAMGATVILLHHIGKTETSRDYRGSSDYKAAIDIGYKLINLGDGARLSKLELKPFKQRFSVDPVLHIRYSHGVFSAEKSDAPRNVTERLCDLLKENPGITIGAFEALATQKGLGRNRSRDFLDKCVEAKTVRVEAGANNGQHHFWIGDEAL